MDKSFLRPVGTIFYVIGAADLLLANLGIIDITGVFWSPVAFGLVGYLCYFYSEEVEFGEGEELLILRDGKKAEVTVTIGMGGTNSSHKLYLTNQKVRIDGGKVSIELPYTDIKSASKDTVMKMDVALKLVTKSGEEYKLHFGIGRSNKRDHFLETLSTKLSENPQAGSNAVQGNDTLAGVAKHNTNPNINYYYYDQTSGEVVGPKTKEEMISLRFGSRINDETQVTEAGVENWQTYQSKFG